MRNLARAKDEDGNFKKLMDEDGLYYTEYRARSREIRKFRQTLAFTTSLSNKQFTIAVPYILFMASDEASTICLQSNQLQSPYDLAVAR